MAFPTNPNKCCSTSHSTVSNSQVTNSKAFLALGITEIFRKSDLHYFTIREISKEPILKSSVPASQTEETQWIDPALDEDALSECYVCSDKYDFSNPDLRPVGLFCHNSEGNLTHLIHKHCIETYWAPQVRGDKKTENSPLVDGPVVKNDCPSDRQHKHVIPKTFQIGLPKDYVKAWLNIPPHLKHYYEHHMDLVLEIQKAGLNVNFTLGQIDAHLSGPLTEIETEIAKIDVLIKEDPKDKSLTEKKDQLVKKRNDVAAKHKSLCNNKIALSLVKNGLSIDCIFKIKLDWDELSFYDSKNLKIFKTDDDLRAYAECKDELLKRKILLNTMLMEKLFSHGYGIKDVVKLERKKGIDFFIQSKKFITADEKTWVSYFGKSPKKTEKTEKTKISLIALFRRLVIGTKVS